MQSLADAACLPRGRAIRRQEAAGACRSSAMTALVAGSAIVTGAGSGIGRAIAARSRRAGRSDRADRRAARGRDGDGRGHQASRVGGSPWRRPTSAGGTRSTARWDAIERDLGPVGILVNAAGILDGYAPADELSPTVWERVIAINLSGTFYCAKRVLPGMLARGRGAHHQHRLGGQRGGLGWRPRLHSVQARRARASPASSPSPTPSAG